MLPNPISRNVSRCLVPSLLLSLTLGAPEPAIGQVKFYLGKGSPPTGFSAVGPFKPEKGFGFRPDGSGILAVDVGEGNFLVTVTFGSPSQRGATIVRSEARRVMLPEVVTAAGASEVQTFTVNVRHPRISPKREVRINSREQGPPISPNWDNVLTLEFTGDAPAAQTVEITRLDSAVTVFLAGDSTVTDQVHGPYAGWGQMLPSFFGKSVVVANHAESGLSLASFESQGRLEKVLAVGKPGDYLLIQFGHNDQKDKSEGAGPFTKYKANLLKFIDAAKKKGMRPVVVTSMERRRWKDNLPQQTLQDFAEAARQAAAEQKVPLVDLHALSLTLYAAMGEAGSTQLFVHHPANTFPNQPEKLEDNTHHSIYGAHQLARCVVEAIRTAVPDLAKHLRSGIAPYSPKKPEDPKSLRIPIGQTSAAEKPAGS